jgi:hypothetical protein
LWWSAHPNSHANADANTNSDTNSDANADSDANAGSKCAEQSDGDGCFHKSNQLVVDG